MINLKKFTPATMQGEPFAWAEIDHLYSAEDAVALARSFPRDHFKTVSGYGGEKNYAYEARALIAMGGSSIENVHELSDVWRRLAHDFLSSEYRQAMSCLTSMDLSGAPLEVNVFHYGPGANLGPHLDLPDKVVTHVLYFNENWNRLDGGCLTILHSADPASIAAEIAPAVGNSAVLVRSDKSWHAVSPVIAACQSSRRSLTATFYRPAAQSSMWPTGDNTALHRVEY
ncbi:MAG: 2OG-Fe(II) oxygenase [Pseudomonadota bacterium]